MFDAIVESTDEPFVAEEPSFTFVGMMGFQLAVQGPVERQLPSNAPIEPTPVLDQSSTAWLATHLDEIAKKYAGKWILVAGKVVASATEPSRLEKQAVKLGIQNPLIVEISKEPAVWNTAYAARGFRT